MTIIPKSKKGLGFKIRGGIEYALGIFISKIESNSDADLAGLRVSDQIIEVNGQTFSRISQLDAVRVIKMSLLNYIANKAPIRLVVRYLGKLPQLTINESESENLENHEKDSLIHLHDSVVSLAKTTNIINEDDLLNNQIISSKLNTHFDYMTDEEVTDLGSIRIHFDSKHDLNLFRYYLNDYLNSRINIQYFLFLITNRILKSFKKVILCENNIYY